MTIRLKYKIEKKIKEKQTKKSVCLNIKGLIVQRHFILSQILNRFNDTKAERETNILKNEIKELEKDFGYYNCGKIENTRPLPPKKYTGGKCMYCTKGLKVKPIRKKKKLIN